MVLVLVLLARALQFLADWSLPWAARPSEASEARKMKPHTVVSLIWLSLGFALAMDAKVAL